MPQTTKKKTVSQTSSGQLASSEAVAPKATAPVAINPYAQSGNKYVFGVQMSTLILVVIFFLAGAFIGSLWKENQMLKAGSTLNGTNQPAVPVADDTAPTAPDAGISYDKVPAITADDHIRGNAKASVMLIEYSDFECPFCGRFHPTTNQVLDEYGDKVGLVYRQYPLSFHPNAQKAAEGSECVAAQLGNEGFWKYADALFNVNIADGKLSPEAITDAATAAGVNLDQFQSCLDSGEMAQKVSSQMTAAATAGVQGTPGTFVVVDGKAVDFIGGALPYEQVKATLDSYIN